MENTKKRTKNTTKKVVTPPYTTDHLIKEIKNCISPLLSKEKLFNEWSSDIAEFMKLHEKDDEYVEEFLTAKRDKKFYKNNFKIVKDNSILLAGKLILSGGISQNEFDSLMLNIRYGLSNMTVYTRGYLESWLYVWENPKYLDNFEAIYNMLIKAEENFNSIYEKSKTVKYKKVDLHDDDTWRIARLEENLITIYQKLLKLSTKIFELDLDDRLYQYSKVLQDFVRKLFNQLIYLAGSFFMEIDDDDIESKAKNTVGLYFEKLENQRYTDKKQLYWVFRDLDDNSKPKNYTDNGIFYSYQELKGAINNMLNSFK